MTCVVTRMSFILELKFYDYKLSTLQHFRSIELTIFFNTATMFVIVNPFIQLHFMSTLQRNSLAWKVHYIQYILISSSNIEVDCRIYTTFLLSC